MIDVRLHRELYSAAAVEEALRVYGPHATLERCDVADHWGVRVSAASPGRERRVAGELANYALGLTVKARSTAAPPSAPAVHARAGEGP